MELPAHVKGKVHEIKETVQAKIEQVKQRLHQGTETLQDRADEATLQAKSLTKQTLGKLSPPVTGRIGHLTEAVRQRPVPGAAVVLGVFLLLVLRRLLRRNR